MDKHTVSGFPDTKVFGIVKRKPGIFFLTFSEILKHLFKYK